MSKNKLTLAAAGVVSALTLGMPAKDAEAANWLMLQGTERDAAAGRAKVWGFIQPEFQYTEGSALEGGAFAGKPAQFNMINPNFTSRATFQIRRARIGVRGQGFPLDGKTNYFILGEFGNNGITVPGGGKGAGKLTDASVTFSHIPSARIRVGQFKYPGSEEGLQAIHVFDYINFTWATDQLLLERFFDAQSGNASPNGSVGAFRDIGVQLFDSKKLTNNWFGSYAFMVGNGNGINRSDNNGAKDYYAYAAAEQIYGGKGARVESLKMFAWYHTGKRTIAEGEFDRTRSGLGATFRKAKYRAAFEYIMADGMIFNGTSAGGRPLDGATFSVLPEDKANGWYVHGGYMVMPKLELDLRYDVLNRGTETTAGERKYSTLTLGAQYFVNKKTRVVFNYEMRDAEAPGLASSHAANDKILGVMDDRISMQVLAIF